MVITHKAVASVMVFTTAFLMLSGSGAPTGRAGVLLASIALAATALFLLAVRARHSRAEAIDEARGLALADAEGPMRMDTNKG
jgi:hypothetical protein